MIYYVIKKCRLGQLLIAATEKGLCSVQARDRERELKQMLKDDFPSDDLIESEKYCRPWSQALLDYLDGKAAWPTLPYDVDATPFQRKVWQRLRKIPSGKTRTYGQLAKAVASPKGARAVARACAANPVLIVVPCHRVVPKSGGIGSFAAGPHRKADLLRLENCNT